MIDSEDDLREFVRKELRGSDVARLVRQLQNPRVVTALPTAASFDGQDIFYRLAGGGVWHLKWNAATAKWDFAGGPSLYAEVTTNESTTSAAYVALATAGPSITLPLAGDYDVALGGRMWNDSANQAAAMSYDIGATGAVDADFITMAQGTGISAGNIARKRRKTGLAAATALVAKYKRVGGVTGFFEARWMSATPVRLG